MMTAIDQGAVCAILADHHTALVDRLRELLRAVSVSVFAVDDSRSLLEGARRLAPGLIIVDLGFGGQDTSQLLRALKADVPNTRIVVLSLYGDAAVANAAMADGADGVVLKQLIGDDLLPAVDAVLSGSTFVSACFDRSPALPPVQ